MINIKTELLYFEHGQKMAYHQYIVGPKLVQSWAYLVLDPKWTKIGSKLCTADRTSVIPTHVNHVYIIGHMMMMMLPLICAAAAIRRHKKVVSSRVK